MPWQTAAPTIAYYHLAHRRLFLVTARHGTLINMPTNGRSESSYTTSP